MRKHLYNLGGTGMLKPDPDPVEEEEDGDPIGQDPKHPTKP